MQPLDRYAPLVHAVVIQAAFVVAIAAGLVAVQGARLPASASERPCAKEGATCGGIAGILCCPGLICKYDGQYPDASGVCKPEQSQPGTGNAPGDKEITDAIRRLDDDDTDVQSEAVLFLGKARVKKAAPALIRKFEKLPKLSRKPGRDEGEKTARLGANIAMALGMIGDAEAVPALLERPEFYFLHGGEAPLAMIGAPALPHLLKIANDKKDPRREKVCMIISGIRDPAAAPALMDVLKDTKIDPRIRRSALAVLGRMKTPGIEPYAHEMLTAQDKDARLGALYWLVKYDPATYAADLLSFLDNRDWYIRSGAARLAGELKVHEAETRLIELLNDKNDSVRHSAAHSLWKLTGKAFPYDKGTFVLSSERSEKNQIVDSIRRNEPKSSQEFHLKQAQDRGYLLEYTIDDLLIELFPRIR